MEKWISKAVGKMHVERITQTELAKELGIRRDYLNKILNGHEKPQGIRVRIEEALNRIVERKASNGETGLSR